MKRKVLFVFDYERDLFRVKQIMDIPDVIPCSIAGFNHNSAYEELDRKSDTDIKESIDKALEETTVTVVCIGEMTYFRKYINSQIKKSYERKNGMLGIHISHLLDVNQRSSRRGLVPVYLSHPNQSRFRIYDYTNSLELYKWIEEAAESIKLWGNSTMK